ncbi:hypothetical protein FSST1_001425 [Fusarium sambucinum]
MVPQTYPDSRITEGFITSDISTTIGSTTGFSSAETTTVASSSTYLSNEESSVIITESISIETSLHPEETSTTALSITVGITSEIATTEAATVTAATTTSAAPSTIPFIRNTGFDDDSSSLAPWELYNGEDTVSIDTNVKHDGPNSARINRGQGVVHDYIRQPLQGSITAGVTYTMSAWVNANLYCAYASLICSYQNNNWAEPGIFDITAKTDEWTYVSTTCTYTQD